MKQKTTLEQIESLNSTGRRRLKQWFFDKEIEPNLLTIGQMIQFLDEEDDFFKCWYRIGAGKDENGYPQYSEEKTKRSLEWEYTDELCDLLWREMKKILETEDDLS